MTQLADIPQNSEIYFVDRLLGLVLDIGASMLACGAQISRVEDSIALLCKAYGAETVEAWTITSLVQATVKMPDGYHTTQIRHVRESSNDLNRLETLNTFVLRVAKEVPPLEQAESEFQAILKKKTGSAWLTVGGALLGAGGFAIFFGGDIVDAIASGVVGAFVMAVALFGARLNINAVVKTFLFCLISGLLAIFCFSLGFGHNIDKIMIGTIMIFAPGILLGNAIKDMLCGDLVAGILKFLQAVITSVAIAVGYAAAMWLVGGLFL